MEPEPYDAFGPPPDAAAEPEDPLIDLEVEMAFIGAMLAQPDRVKKMIDLPQEIFADGAHKRIWRTMVAETRKGRPATAAAMRRIFVNVDVLQDLGGAKYLAELAAGAVGVVEYEDYARLLNDLYARRQIVALGEELAAAARAFDIESDPAELLTTNATRMNEIFRASAFSDEAIISVGESMDMVVDDLRRIQAGEQPPGIRSGIDALDATMGNMEGGDLIVIAGRPGMGKSALALSISHNIARDVGDVLFFNLEMRDRQMARRSLSAFAGVSGSALKSGRVGNERMQWIQDAAERNRDLPLFYYRARGMRVEQLVATARRRHAESPLAFIAVDYLQLLQTDYGGGRASRDREIGFITGELKTLAMDLDVPIAILSQLNRAVEQRDDKRPQAADLRDSGNIEQDADVILFCYREHEYLKKARPSEKKGADALTEWEVDMAATRTQAEVIVGKLRGGEAGRSAMLKFIPEQTRFLDPDGDDESPATPQAEMEWLQNDDGLEDRG